MRQVKKFMDSLSLLFPVGEQFFVKTLRQYEPTLSKEDQEELSGFFGDEARHTRWHRAHNETLGVDVDYIDSVTDKRLYNSSRTLFDSLKTTMVLEALTYSGAKIVPLLKPLLKQSLSGGELAMWEQHAKEEVEHVPVVHRVGKNLGVSNKDLLLHSPKVVYNLISQVVFNYKRL